MHQRAGDMCALSYAVAVAAFIELDDGQRNKVLEIIVDELLPAYASADYECAACVQEVVLDLLEERDAAYLARME